MLASKATAEQRDWKNTSEFYDSDDELDRGCHYRHGFRNLPSLPRLDRHRTHLVIASLIHSPIRSYRKLADEVLGGGGS